MQCLTETFSGASDMEAAITKACDECGTIYLPTDNMLAMNMAAVKRISLEKGTKVFASTEGMCKAGALAAYGIDPDDSHRFNEECQYGVKIIELG